MPGIEIKRLRISDDARALLSIFLPLYAIHCVEQIYFIYGNVLQMYGFTPQIIGLVLGAYFAAIMLLRHVGGWMLENLGIRNTLMASSLLGFLGCAILFFSKNFLTVLTGRLLAGAAFGVYTMGLYSYQALSAPEGKRGAYFAITASGGVLPAATITPVGEWLLINGWLGIYLSVGPILCLACFLLGSKTGGSRSATGASPKNWGSYRDLAASKPFVMLAVTGTMMALVDAATVSISLFAAERHIVASYFLASASVAAVAFRLGCSRLMNSLPRSFCVAPCGMLMCCALLAVSLFPSNASFLLCGAIFGLGIGAGFPMMLAALSDTLPPELRPKGTACALFLYDAGWTATPLIVGYMTPLFGLARTFLALSLVTFAVLALLLIFYWAPARCRVSSS
jgi:MFS family permease